MHSTSQLLINPFSRSLSKSEKKLFFMRTIIIGMYHLNISWSPKYIQVISNRVDHSMIWLCTYQSISLNKNIYSTKIIKIEVGSLSFISLRLRNSVISAKVEFKLPFYLVTLKGTQNLTDLSWELFYESTKYVYTCRVFAYSCKYKSVLIFLS